MHPFLMSEIARQRHEQLMHDAEEARRARSAPHRCEPGSGMRYRVKAALGNRLVATGWRLVETGLPRAQALAPVVRPCPGDEAPC